jgi:hypothetical protein
MRVASDVPSEVVVKSFYLALSFVSFVVACEPLPDTRTAALVNAPQGTSARELAVTVEESVPLSSPAVGALAFRFANAGAEFLHIDRVLIDFGGEKENQSVIVLSDSDLESWSEGIAVRNRERQYRRDATMLGLAIAADVLVGAASFAHSKGHHVPPPAATQLVLTAAMLRDESSSEGARFPDSHLLDVPFSVPPKLGVSRWVALQTRDPGAPCIHFVSLRVLVRERGWLQFATSFRGADTLSEWQSDRCGRPASAPSRDAW